MGWPARTGARVSAFASGGSLKTLRKNSKSEFYPSRVQRFERIESFEERLCVAVAVERPIGGRGLDDGNAISQLLIPRPEDR